MTRIIFTLTTIVILLVVGCSESDNTPASLTSLEPPETPSPTPMDEANAMLTPDGSVRGYLVALDAGDIEDYCKYWYEDDECIRDSKDVIEELGELNVAISDVNATTICTLGVEAVVEVSYKVQIENNGTTVNGDMHEIVELEKFGDQWLIWHVEDKEENTEYYIHGAAKKEFSFVQHAVGAMMVLPEISVENLNIDPRIAGFTNDPSNPTNKMVDGGLITLAPEYFINSGTVHPVSYTLGRDITGLYYIVDAEGNVRAFYDENGENEVE